MIKKLKEHNRTDETLFLVVLSIMCFVLSVFRYTYTDTKLFLFLNWNLFLAFIPWLLSTILIVYPKLRGNRLTVSVLIIGWLLFFPNAPYILTDLFHLGSRGQIPIWFDLILILSFAWTGLLFGFISLWNIESIFAPLTKKKYIPVLSAILMFIGSFGIYVGRYLRWNSWDILTKPFSLLYDIGDRLINPFNHARTWAMTIMMFFFLELVYWSFKLLMERKEKESIH